MFLLVINIYIKIKILLLNKKRYVKLTYISLKSYNFLYKKSHSKTMDIKYLSFNILIAIWTWNFIIIF